jgi:hypothetical protein
MSNYGKVLLSMGLLSLLSASPLTAQIGNGVKFNTRFPFYVGNTKMPAGSYTLTEPDDIDSHVILVRSTEGLDTALTQIIGTESSQPPSRSVVVFEKYGDTLYLDKVLIDGNTSGVMVLPTKAEKRAEESASIAEQRSITASGE